MEVQNVDQTALHEVTSAEPAPSGKGKKIALIAVGAAAAVLLAGYLVFCLLAASRQTILPGVQVMGVPVGGMTIAQAAQVLDERADAYCRETRISLLIDGEEAAQASLSQLGAGVSGQDAAQKAFDSGHAGNFFSNGWHYITALVKKHEIGPPLSYTASGVKDGADALAQQLSYAQTDGTYRLGENETDGFYLIKCRDGRTVDAAALEKALAEALSAGRFDPVACTYTTQTAQPLDVDALYETIHGGAVNAAYDKATGGLTDGRPGVEFDTAAAKSLLASAQPGQEVRLAATVQYPEVTKEKLQEVLFRDVLGSYTTYVSGSYGRLTNVKQAARNISGYILNTGEVFSYNDAVGEQSAATGFYPAPGYSAGKTVMVYGGGVCQVSSTLYYACLLSNLEITLRYCHQFAPSYIPFGCDATVSDGGCDYQFRNDTPYPIKVVTYYSSGNQLTVEIQGTKTNDNYVRIISKTLSSTPYDVVYEETEELAPGEKELEQSPYTGYYVETYRNIYSADGTLLSSTFEDSSDYEMRNEIYKIGKKLPDTAPAVPGSTTAPAA